MTTLCLYFTSIKMLSNMQKPGENIFPGLCCTAYSLSHLLKYLLEPIIPSILIARIIYHKS